MKIELKPYTYTVTKHYWNCGKKNCRHKTKVAARRCSEKPERRAGTRSDARSRRDACLEDWAGGGSFKDIAHKHGFSASTVRGHVTSIRDHIIMDMQRGATEKDAIRKVSEYKKAVSGMDCRVIQLIIDRVKSEPRLNLFFRDPNKYERRELEGQIKRLRNANKSEPHNYWNPTRNRTIEKCEARLRQIVS